MHSRIFEVIFKVNAYVKMNKTRKKEKAKTKGHKETGDGGYVYLDCGGGIIDACVYPNSSSYTH